MRKAVTVILAAAGLAACAPTEGAPTASRIATADSGARQCFSPSRITNFTRAGTDQIYVRALGGGVFSVRSAGCPDLGTANSLALTPLGGLGGSDLCVGDSARIQVANNNFGPPQCIARVERSLSPAEVEALPSRERP